MAIRLEIPATVVSSLRLPEAEAGPRLLLELAVALYGREMLPFGKACELAQVSRYEFADLIAGRGIVRHYSEEDLALDLEFAAEG